MDDSSRVKATIDTVPLNDIDDESFEDVDYEVEESDDAATAPVTEKRENVDAETIKDEL